MRPGDTVTWKNNDTKPHSVISDTGVFKSEPIAPGQSYSFKFDVESSYAYHDGTNTSRTGAVHVLTNNVSIGLTRMRAVFRNPVGIFGSIPNGATGETVTIHITPYGKSTFTRTAVTESGSYELEVPAGAHHRGEGELERHGERSLAEDRRPPARDLQDAERDPEPVPRPGQGGEELRAQGRPHQPPELTWRLGDDADGSG